MKNAGEAPPSDRLQSGDRTSGDAPVGLRAFIYSYVRQKCSDDIELPFTARFVQWSVDAFRFCHCIWGLAHTVSTDPSPPLAYALLSLSPRARG